MLTIWPISGQLREVSLYMFHPGVLYYLHYFGRHILPQNIRMFIEVYNQSVHSCDKCNVETGSFVKRINKPQETLCHNDIWWLKVIMTLSFHILLSLIHCDSVKLTHVSLKTLTTKCSSTKWHNIPLPYCFIIPTQYPIMPAYLGQRQL